jgi:hypothetical protein
MFTFQEISGGKIAVHHTPFYHLGMEMVRIAYVLTEDIKGSTLLSSSEFRRHQLQRIIHELNANVYLITNKFAEVYEDASYDQLMETATLIRKAAREVNVLCNELTLLDKEHLRRCCQMVDAIEKLKPHFKEWVINFKGSRIEKDDWGLFQPELML